jgi:hypothetical protein
MKFSLTPPHTQKNTGSDDPHRDKLGVYLTENKKGF